ncbi:MAG: RidA family protein [Mesorhizobium sp.]
MHGIVAKNEFIFLGGIAAKTLDTDMYDQAKQVFAQIEEKVSFAGSNKRSLLSVQIFITDMTLKGEMNRAWREWLDEEDFPARATIGVADLGPGILIEVSVVAVKA